MLAKAPRKIALATLFALLYFCTMAVGQDRPTYTISVAAENARLAIIDADLPLTGNTILMSPEGAPHLPQGWATFVRNLTALNGNGAAVALTAISPGRWKVSDPLPTRIRLRYEIQLTHNQQRWPFGYDEAAYAKEDCIFYTGAALFIGQFELHDIRVHFDLPTSWRIAVPWTEIGRHTFSVPDVEELINVGMLIGRHDQREVERDAHM